MSRLTERSRRHRAQIIIPVVSMGDIAFLLIIFFILCSNFAKKAGKNVEPPVAPRLEALPKPRIYVAVDSERRLYFQGKLIGSAGEIEAELSHNIDPNASVDARTVIFECDRSVTKDVFEPILESIAKGGGIIGAVGKEGVRKE
ncbi:MAG: biopolymer transporter ExbD [Phycisphaerae bacterium]